MGNSKIKDSILSIYKATVPRKLRDRITMSRDAGGLNTLRKNMLSYYSNLGEQNINDDQRQVISYLKKNPVRIFPYAFPEKYNRKNVKVHFDESNGLLYVIQDNKKLYFKRSWTKSDVRDNYNNLLIEQDEQSPHRYLNNEFDINEGSTVVDIGTAEGNFALSVVEKADMMYLFETDTEWIEALNTTFAPWRNKVKIINKYVSDHNDAHSMTLDSYFENIHKIDFLKIDVDGAEMQLLSGARDILSKNQSFKIAICTYHQQGDEKLFTEFLEDTGFRVSPSKGYMIYIYDKQFEPPYLRRGLL